MKKEELKENVRGYAQKFEDDGLRLLKKGQKGIVHAIFSRFGLVLVLLLLQVGLLFSIFRWFGNLLPHYFGGSVVVTAAMVVYLLNSKMDNSAKITWMVVVAILPVVGVPLFFYVKSNAGHNLLRKRLMELENTLRPQLPQNREVVERLRRAEPGAASLANYLHGPGGGFPVYENTAMTYFPSGEAKFAELLRQLDTAEKYIFVEYFIIDEGLFWGRVLEILARKAAEVARRARYNSDRGELAERPANLPLREDGTHDFTAPAPGMLAVTDVTEFALDGFKAYLSPAIDCFDGWPVCWRVSRHPDKALMVGMLEDLVGAVRPTADRPLVVHSDGGAVYMGDDWARACEAGHVTRSMSRKARSPDNARCEGFFGTLKSDFFGGRDWAGVTFEEFSRRLDAYIEWYRSEKVKKALGWKSIRRHREGLGYTA